MNELRGLSGAVISILPVILCILIFWLVMRFLIIKYIGKEWYERKIISILLVMGFVSGVVGWHVQLVPVLHQFLALGHKTTFHQWFLSVLIFGSIGVGIALLFPLWQKYIKIQSFLLQSLVFWFSVSVLLLIGYGTIFVGYRWIIFVISFSFKNPDRLFFNFAGKLVPGICFYLLGILLRFDKYLKTSIVSER